MKISSKNITILILILKYYFFWILFFEFSRLYFFIVNYSESKHYSLNELFSPFIHGFLLDISAASYILFFSMPIFIICHFLGLPKVLKYFLNIYTGIFLAFSLFYIVADGEIYKSWGFRIDAGVFQYLKSPNAAVASITNLRLIFLFFIFTILSISFYCLYHFWISKKIVNILRNNYITLLIIIFTAALFIPIRGGIGVVPINSGVAYFSDKTFLNHAALNLIWYGGKSLIESPAQYERYEYFDDKKLQEYFSMAFNAEDTNINILKKKPQKIIFVILESFTAAAVNFENPSESVTPKLQNWLRNGILFNKFYANGDRSEKGIVSILSAVPTMPDYSIMKNPKQTQRITSLIKRLNEIGYSSYFYYGGDINFSNMQSYLYNIGIGKIKSKNNLNLDCKSGKWGFHDECMFELFANDIIADTDTAIYILFTLSSHEPYDVPYKGPFELKDYQQKCDNAYFYTDSCLNEFLTRIKNSDVWNNSLIVLVADHGTRYNGVEVWAKQKFHILMHITGGILNINGDFMLCDKTADQSDITATLLGALGADYKEFIFSENIFRKKVTNAFYAYHHGFAFIKGGRWVIYDSNPQKFVYRGWNSEIIDNQAKAYMQMISRYHKNLFDN
jgi:phosphoglycerol transferase MdoB-like AlkP superfamily enzyme